MTARHHLAQGTFTDEQLVQDIQNDVQSARGAQLSLEAAGQHKGAADMGRAADEYLDELNDAKQGKWSPRHA
jgi:hypothetical protein